MNSAVVDLQSAATRPNTRDRMLEAARDVLTRSITGDGQEKNPAVWYYFGRYYVEMKDGAGADSAFRKALALAPRGLSHPVGSPTFLIVIANRPWYRRRAAGGEARL